MSEKFSLCTILPPNFSKEKIYKNSRKALFNTMIFLTLNISKSVKYYSIGNSNVIN